MLNVEERSDLAEMTKAILRKIGGFFDVRGSVVAAFDEVCKETVELPAGTQIVEQGGKYSDIFLIDSGWVIRSRTLANGARQIVNVAIPGDFVALNALLFEHSDFELSCQTEMNAYRFTSDELGNALARDRNLMAALFWVNAHEESLLAERIVSLGRRSARARTAHVLCEFISRLEIIGINDVEQLAIPISQDDLADILGTSIVHTNKTLRSLEKDDIVVFKNSMLMVMNRKRLEIEAGFDDGYLHFTRRSDRRGSDTPELIM